MVKYTKTKAPKFRIRAVPCSHAMVGDARVGSRNLGALVITIVSVAGRHGDGLVVCGGLLTGERWKEELLMTNMRERGQPKLYFLVVSSRELSNKKATKS